VAGTGGKTVAHGIDGSAALRWLRPRAFTSPHVDLHVTPNPRVTPADESHRLCHAPFAHQELKITVNEYLRPLRELQGSGNPAPTTSWCDK